MRSIIIAGTGTDVGKTLLSAAIMRAHPEYRYWKPVQSGTVPQTDRDAVIQLSGCDTSRIIAEAYVFREPLSPHLASSLEGVTINASALRLPSHSDDKPMIVECAGGVMVPLNDTTLYIDMIEQWKLPVLLACRSELGTINHTLLTLEALRARNVEVLGAVLVGKPNKANEDASARYGSIEVMGRIPLEGDLTPEMILPMYEKHLSRLGEVLNEQVAA